MTIPESLLLQKLQCGYRRDHPLSTITRSVRPGTLIHVKGKNGSGKSTLLRTLGGLLPALDGTVIINGNNLPSPAYLREVGAVVDTLLLHPYLTAEEHLSLAASLYEITTIPDICRTLCDDLQNTISSECSSGQRTRLTLAMSLVHSPALWLLDEPWNALDQAASELLTSLILQKLAEGTIIFTTTHHELPEALTSCHEELSLSC
jgi:ABC-type multidrug transport system ATPase subunit